ncbi:MAG: class I SAM-dependent methyltransferase [Isosphaeraceae bacterium]|nr:class I SAM-dependent methyltransferase [Isosphaeraceae bacterium]
MTQPMTYQPRSTTTADLLRCLDCATILGGRATCPGCGRAYLERGGIVEAIGPLSGRNRIAAMFYDGPGWRRFRPWERLFLALQGGQRRARRPILRHLPPVASARILEVGIGDGDNLPLLPPAWEVHGVDIARTRLEDCLRRFPEQAGRLAWAEAEALPYPDATFDACLCVGGFTFFRDHEAALREMRRVTRPGGPVVVADEVPWLCRLGIGHILGVPEIDAWWFRGLGLDREFIAMVLDLRLDLDAVVAATLPGARRHAIWAGLGYCVVHR